MFICDISVFNKHGKQLLDTYLEPLQVDWREMVVLLVVEKVPGIAQGRLTPFLQTDKANVTKLLQTMEHLGLLQREEDPEDHRSRTCHLTTKSLALLPKIHDTMKKWEDHCFRGLTVEELALFATLRRKVGYNLTGHFDL